MLHIIFLILKILGLLILGIFGLIIIAVAIVLENIWTTASRDIGTCPSPRHCHPCLPCCVQTGGVRTRYAGEYKRKAQVPLAPPPHIRRAVL